MLNAYYTSSILKILGNFLFYQACVYKYVYGFFLSLFLMAYQLFLGYLMPKRFSEKNSRGTI